MKRGKNFASFLSGVLVTLLVFGAAVPTLAANSSSIEILRGIKVFMDDKEFNMTDANGKRVEAFASDGTTYLPVRAVSEALNLPVQWDGKTWSVYIGKHQSSTPAAYLSQLDYFSGTSNSSFKTEASEKDNNGDYHYNCITHDFERSYNLNGNYSRISGIIYQKYSLRSYTAASSRPNQLEIYGDDQLLYVHTIAPGSTGIDPIPFDVDLTGVLRLRVKFQSCGVKFPYEEDLISLGDTALWT